MVYVASKGQAILFIIFVVKNGKPEKESKYLKTLKFEGQIQCCYYDK